MEFEFFWDLYIKREEAPLTHQLILEVFDGPFSDNVNSDYDIPETVFFILDFYEKQRDPKGLLEFQALLKKDHPENYREMEPYIHDNLLPFFIYHQQAAEIAGLIQEAAADPLQDFDSRLKVINILKYTEYGIRLGPYIDEIYPVVEQAPSLLDSAALEIAIIKNYLVKAGIFEEYKASGTWD